MAERQGGGRIELTALSKFYGSLKVLNSIDLVIESGLKAHDWAALVPVVRGAGGMIGDWQGGTDLSSGSIVAAASEELFEQAVRTLAA